MRYDYIITMGGTVVVVATNSDNNCLAEELRNLDVDEYIAYEVEQGRTPELPADIVVYRAQKIEKL
jgi:hypothetical protein